jgi:hypothetical protein
VSLPADIYANHSSSRSSAQATEGRAIKVIATSVRPLERALFQVNILHGCESASEFDPSFLGQFNELARRSALGPHAQ